MPDENPSQAEVLYRALSRAILLAAGVFLLFWFTYEALLAVLFALTSFILALALNPPVVWLEKRGLGRVWATLLVMLAVLAVSGAVLAVVVPRLASQLSILAANVPGYAQQLNARALEWLEGAPVLREAANDFLSSDRQLLSRVGPLAQGLLARVGGYTLSLIGVMIFGLLLLSTVIYTLVQPQPLLQSYIHVFPPRLRDQAERAYRKSAGAVAGWLWSNAIVGALEAVLATIALSLLHVPGALVWGALTLFAELVPQVSAYLMMVPPVLVALAVDPMLAVWVALFYLVMMKIMGNVVTPLVRSSTMNLHPVSLLFSVLAMGAVFGILGALIATPAAGIFKAFYDEFFASTRPDDPQADERTTRMLRGEEAPRQDEPHPEKPREAGVGGG